MNAPFLSLPQLIHSVVNVIADNAETVTTLDQAIGDGDHVINLQRGLEALSQQADELAQLNWDVCLQTIGMTLVDKIGGASGALFGTLFIAMGQQAKGHALNLQTLSDAFSAGVEATQRRGKADVGEKTMLDVLIPVAHLLQQHATSNSFNGKALCECAQTGVESTREMIATKGRASSMGQRSRGHLDAGAKTCQLMICAIITDIEQV